MAIYMYMHTYIAFNMPFNFLLKALTLDNGN